METQEKTLEQVLEEGEERFPQITALHRWSMNFDAGQTPFTVLIDLIGYSSDQFGEGIYNYGKPALGYLELDYLGDALKEYADKGESAYIYIEQILDAEGRE